MNEFQKKAVIEYIEQNMLGEVLATPESTEEELQKVFDEEYIEEEEQEEIRQALKDGNTIYYGLVCFGELGYAFSDIAEDIWGILEKNSDGNFKAINDDLSY